ncbi:MAG TPA: exonuclease SbcCD subunit D, partial [Kineosporiaceae bacterium]|nr:exonuclease SbcCD subunit D [Kineosporiaceae bacterium]
MRLLHTSDWHLGRSFHRVGLLGDQAAVLDHLVEVVRAERVDVVVVAGDVYDRALPAVDVVSLLDDTLARLVATGAEVVLTSGNHDSARRLGFGSRLLEAARLHVRTDPARLADPVLLQDRHGPVALYPLPYLEPALVSGELAVTAGHEAVLGRVMELVRADLADRPPGTRSVVAAHAFVAGGQASDSERDISTGGVQAVPSGVFDGVDYVALGHLHGRQRLAEAVRYSGSPLAYSFSECGQVKGAWLVELERGGLGRAEAVDTPVPRSLAVLRGRLPELLTDPALARHEDAWCQVTLTDPQRPREAMQQVRSRFPHALELRFEPEGGSAAAGRSYTERVRGRDDIVLTQGFLEHVRGREAAPAELALLRRAVQEIRLGEAEQRGASALRPRSAAGDHATVAEPPEPVTVPAP